MMIILYLSFSYLLAIRYQSFCDFRRKDSSVIVSNGSRWCVHKYSYIGLIPLKWKQMKFFGDWTYPFLWMIFLRSHRCCHMIESSKCWFYPRTLDYKDKPCIAGWDTFSKVIDSIKFRDSFTNLWFYALV